MEKQKAKHKQTFGAPRHFGKQNININFFAQLRLSVQKKRLQTFEFGLTLGSDRTKFLIIRIDTALDLAHFGGAIGLNQNEFGFRIAGSPPCFGGRIFDQFGFKRRTPPENVVGTLGIPRRS